jgi:hypothetical protein
LERIPKSLPMSEMKGAVGFNRTSLSSFVSKNQYMSVFAQGPPNFRGENYCRNDYICLYYFKNEYVYIYFEVSQASEVKTVYGRPHAGMRQDM